MKLFSTRFVCCINTSSMLIASNVKYFKSTNYAIIFPYPE